MARQTPLETLLTPRASALTDVVARAVAGEPEAVHQARVASRRLREVLPALAVADPKAWRGVRKDARRVTQALGGVRELDVAASHLEEALAAVPMGAPAGATARRALQVARAAALSRARKTLTAARLARLEARLDAVAAHTPAPDALAVAHALTARVQRRARALAAAVDRVGAVYVPGRLHDVRIAVKRLRYALEARSAARGGRASTQVRQLRLVQDLLGRAHDLHVLDEFLRDVQARVVRRSRAMARDLARLSSELDRECRALHAAFMSRRRGLLTLSSSLSAGVSAGAARVRTVA